MNNQLIYDLLVTRLRTVAGLLPLQLENTSNDTSKPFSRATLIRTKPEPASLGRNGQDIHSGSLLVDLYTPTNTGTTTVNALADAVIAAFPRGLRLTSGAIKLRIMTAYRETGGREFDKFHNAPVVVEWTLVLPAS